MNKYQNTSCYATSGLQWKTEFLKDKTSNDLFSYLLDLKLDTA